VTRTVTKGINTRVKAGVEFAGLDTGIKWELQEAKDVKYSACLTSMSCCSEGKSREENAVT
jgi:hypothetical protein